MMVVCSLFITVNAGGVPVMSKADVEGKLLKEDQTKYLVDFSEGVKKYDITGKPEYYKKTLVNKNDCIKE
jgi:hypothetical protein